MNFARVDPIICSWSSKNKMSLATHYQNAEVRSFELVGELGRVQIWVEVNGQISVHLRDFRSRRRSFVTALATLEASLDQALAVARQWVFKT